MKGWYGDKQQHSLASKGIRTKAKQCKAMGLYNYYEQLYPIVMDYVESYQNDFLKWDKQDFDSGLNEFILGIRKTGTHLYKIDFDENTTPEGRLSRSFDYDDRYFYGKDGEIVEVSREEAEEIFKQRVKETESERKYPITDFEKVDNYDVFEDAVKKIDERQYYGMRDVPVIPKKRYTFGYWSNGDASWHFREQVFHDDIAKLDANEILLPYKIDQVLGVSYALPPLPLFAYSYEAKKLMGAEEQENMTIQWALKQLESKFMDENASDYERMSAKVMLENAKKDFGLEQQTDKRSEWL